jgi:uncharacterized protein
MNKIEAIDKLQRQAQAIKAMGATALYLFGSVAQDEAGRGSDLDLFIDYDPNGRFNAFDLVGIKQLLESELGVDVDITTIRCCVPTSNNRPFKCSNERLYPSS